MVYQQTLGIDQQDQGIPFYRFINPTDLDKVVKKMVEVINDNHSFDLVNPSLWALVGLGGDTVAAFMKRYILVARQLRKTLTQSTRAIYEAELNTRYGYNDKALDEYLDAYLQVLSAGLVPDSIARPWNYNESSIQSDILKTLIPLVLGAVAVYGVATVGLPVLIGQLGSKKVTRT